jgi:P27 family predicted phage terminase small subunit
MVAVGLRPVAMKSNPVSHAVPYELAKLRGFPGKRKMHPGPRPARTEQVPEPPEGLPGDAREVWLYLAPRLHCTGLLSEVDTIAFEVLCRTVARWRAIERQIDEAGPVMAGSPYLKAVAEAAAAVLRAGAAFGLDPAARVRLAAGGHQGPPPDEGEWRGLLA